MRLIREAKRPVLYVGGGVIRARAYRELAQLAALTGIPVVTTLMGIGAIDTADDLSLRIDLHAAAKYK